MSAPAMSQEPQQAACSTPQEDVDTGAKLTTRAGSSVMEQQHVGEDAKQPGCAAHNASNVASSNVASSGPAAAQPSGTTKPAAVRLKPNNPIAKFKRPTNIKAPSSKPGASVDAKSSKYLEELERYRSQSCASESTDRPLVK